MTEFVFTPLTNDPYKDIQSAALGTPAAKFTNNEIGKLVKLSVADPNSYELAADGDDIEALVLELEPASVNSGYAFGSIQKNKRFIATTAAALAPRDFVVCDAQDPVGTPVADYPKVKAGAGVQFKWRVIRVMSATKVLIEKV
jgi:hypothetical protein